MTGIFIFSLGALSAYIFYDSKAEEVMRDKRGKYPSLQ
jgi:hypothetical protein